MYSTVKINLAQQKMLKLLNRTLSPRFELNVRFYVMFVTSFTYQNQNKRRKKNSIIYGLQIDNNYEFKIIAPITSCNKYNSRRQRQRKGSDAVRKRRVSKR